MVAVSADSDGSAGDAARALIRMGQEVLDEIDAAIFAELTAQFREPELTEANMEHFRAAWHKATTDPRALRRNRRMNLRRNLSRKARSRLWWHHAGNSAFIWLTGRGRIGLAVARKLWRI